VNPQVQEIVNAVLYEGYILYPYRASSIKNQRERFTFGRVYPKWYSQAQGGLEPCVMQTECLVESEEGAAIDVSVRFLQPSWREIGTVDGPISLKAGASRPAFTQLPELRVGETVYQTWQEAIEREVTLPPFELRNGEPMNTSSQRCFEFQFGAMESWEPIQAEQAQPAGIVVRSSEPIEGKVELTVRPLERGLFKVTVLITNNSPPIANELRVEDRGQTVLMRTFASTHTILSARGGSKFISLLDPPEQWTTSRLPAKIPVPGPFS